MECTFYQNNQCKVLLGRPHCETCGFRKTTEEYINGIAKSDEILEKKGLVPVILKQANRAIMTTRRIDR